MPMRVDRMNVGVWCVELRQHLHQSPEFRKRMAEIGAEAIDNSIAKAFPEPQTGFLSGVDSAPP